MRVLAMEFAEETEVGYGALPCRSCVGFAITMVGIPEGMSGETQISISFPCPAFTKSSIQRPG